MKKTEIHILHCGQVQVDEAIPFKQKTLNPFAFAGLFRSKKHQITLPVSAYLIKHPKGNVLIDTGWDSNVREGEKKQIEQFGYFQYKASKAILPDGEAIDEQLERLGVKPSDLKYVIITHLDTDHVDGIRLVKDAQNIMVSEQEWISANKFSLRYVEKLWRNIPIKTFQFQQTGIGSRGNSFDLFGDGTIELIHSPGHSKGLVVVKIEHNDKFVILTSDCGYDRKSWGEMILPGLYYDKEIMLGSLRWIQKMSQSSNCIEAIANHDPDVKPHVIEL